jgi:hypothetical protein
MLRQLASRGLPLARAVQDDGAAITSRFDGDSIFYDATFVIPVRFTSPRLAAHGQERADAEIPMFFLIANLCVLTAWLRYARGERLSTWSPSQRISTLPSLAAAESIDTHARLRGHTS